MSGVEQLQWTYAYDDDYRLSSAKPSTGATDSYIYDAVGNIKSHIGSAGTVDGTYDDTNGGELRRQVVCKHDLNGNLLNDGVRIYKWDAENRLISIALSFCP